VPISKHRIRAPAPGPISAEVRRAPRNVDRARLLQGLAGVGDLGAHELGKALLDALRDLAQQRTALRRRQPCPRPAQRRARGLYGAIDERLIRLGDRGQDRPLRMMFSKLRPGARTGTDEAGSCWAATGTVGVGGQPHRVRILGKASGLNE